MHKIDKMGKLCIWYNQKTENQIGSFFLSPCLLFIPIPIRFSIPISFFHNVLSCFMSFSFFSRFLFPVYCCYCCCCYCFSVSINIVYSMVWSMINGSGASGLFITFYFPGFMIIADYLKFERNHFTCTFILFSLCPTWN